MSPVERGITGFMNVHCGSDLPVNRHGFGAVGAPNLQLAENPPQDLSLAAGWLDVEASDFRHESAWKECCHFLHFTSPEHSSAGSHM